MRGLLVLLFMPGVIVEGIYPSVIVVGAGPSGIAAASRLLDNGITDITILEAEGRIGGRVNSTKFGEYWVDLGGQWVHGEKNNAAYDLGDPLGLLSKSVGPGRVDEESPIYRCYTSQGEVILKEIAKKLVIYAEEIPSDPSGMENLKTGSYGEHVNNKLYEFYDNHTEEIPDDMRRSLTHAVRLVMMSSEGAADLNDLSLKKIFEYEGTGGYQLVNWKERTYHTVLEILMKKIPNPEEELPVVNKTLLNKQVIKIIYDEEGVIRLMTSDGTEYTADHVIFTTSLGVLKADHEKIFEPRLPEKNRNAIETLGFGQNAKILLYYDHPWWNTNEFVFNLITWTDSDRKEMENDPERSWMLGIGFTVSVEYKPNLFFIWMSGPYCEAMENISEELFKNQTIKFIERFFGNHHHLTRPKDIIRSRWNTNENFRGSYSYPALASVDRDASPEDLGTPVTRNNKPVILFAGEATEPHHYATVHGAIVSGWREADRLINLYKNVLK
ncbi:spermine oxidase-like [Fopius arisanus]|uniref:Smox_1 protein n=1 Tax=Fopius arisanus TaxID=64838 RepID=A0A0C9PIV6_9HYME|nr:PREDICTED: spermine oxidase-like [Fopius arisanus]